MTDHDPVIRDAFHEDVLPMAPALQERLWTSMEQRRVRHVRRRYLARAGAVLLAGAAVGGLFALRQAFVSSTSADVASVPALAADSIPTFSPAEPPMIQGQAQLDVPSNLIPLLGHRSSLQMDITRYEAQIDALARRLTQTTGAEHDVVERQLSGAENQLEAAKAALVVVDRQLSGREEVVHTASSISVIPDVHMGGPLAMPDEIMYAGGLLGGGLLLVSLALLVYMRRIARMTRESLALVESQISSQHATLASGIDAIALEVERLGEGQRFMSSALARGEPQRRAGEATA